MEGGKRGMLGQKLVGRAQRELNLPCGISCHFPADRYIHQLQLQQCLHSGISLLREHARPRGQLEAALTGREQPWTWK